MARLLFAWKCSVINKKKVEINVIKIYIKSLHTSMDTQRMYIVNHIQLNIFLDLQSFVVKALRKG